MHYEVATITSITLEPLGRPACIFDWKELRAGQALSAVAHESGASYRQVLYPTRIDGSRITVIPHPSLNWKPGTKLDLYGPMGPGFRPSSTCNRWLLLPFENDIGRLYPLIDLALQRKAEISVGIDTSHLPPQVEIARDLTATMEWADYLALDCSLENWYRWRKELENSGLGHPNQQVEVLLNDELPCGFGGCDACALPRGRGAICTHGPVFPLEQLTF
jgi:hypothetical protein